MARRVLNGAETNALINGVTDMVDDGLHAIKVYAGSVAALQARLLAEPQCMEFLLIDRPQDRLMGYQHTERDNTMTHGGTAKRDGARRIPQAPQHRFGGVHWRQRPSGQVGFAVIARVRSGGACSRRCLRSTMPAMPLHDAVRMEVTRYGSDKHGLICGYLFANGQAGISIDLEHAVAWLRAVPVADPGADTGGFLWLHFNLSEADAEAWIRHNLDVVPQFFEALREGSRSTRIEDAHDTLVAVINDVAYEFAFDPSEIETLWVNATPRMAISARVHPLRSIDRLRQAVREGRRFESSVAFLNHLLHDQGDVLVRILREATVKVDAIEDALLIGRLQHKRAELGKLRRVLVRLQRLLAPEPGALFRLLRLPPPWMTPGDLEGLRQGTEEFTLIIRDLAELQERIKLLQEEIAAQLGEQTNRSLFTLTVVTVLALPINIVAGLLGMNVGGIPLAEDAHGFIVIVGIILTFTVLAGWLAFRKRD